MFIFNLLTWELELRKWTEIRVSQLAYLRHCHCKKKRIPRPLQPARSLRALARYPHTGMYHIISPDCSTTYHFYSDSDMARAAWVFQPVVNVKKDYDSDSDTEKTSNKLSHEDITIKERYDKVWQGSEVVVVIIIIIIILIIIIMDDNNNYNKSVFLSCTCSWFAYVLF